MTFIARPAVALLFAAGISLSCFTAGCTNRPYSSPEEQAQNACQALGPKALSGALIGGLGGGAGGAAIGGAAAGGKGAAIGAGIGILAGVLVGLSAGHNVDGRDCARAQLALAQIRDVPIGQAVAWTSPTGSAGSYTPISAEYAGLNGTFCRKVNQQVKLRGHEATGSELVTCRTADGNYQIVGPVET